MIILEILKWVGIILLWLLLILLCVLLLVLFLPIKYYGEGTYNKEQQYVFLKARWFWGLVRIKATFPQKPYLSVKVLWRELLKNQENETVKEEDKQNIPDKPVEKVNKQAKENSPETTEEAILDKPIKRESENTPKKVIETPEAKENEEPKEPFFDKWIGIKEKIKYYIDIFNEQDTKDVLTHCKVRILKILKSIRPRKIKFRGTVGFESPDTTGYLYGGYCIVSSYLGKDFILTPDFENEIMDVSGSLKGHITVFVLVWNALRVYFDKRLMRLISKLKKGGR